MGRHVILAHSGCQCCSNLKFLTIGSGSCKFSHLCWFKSLLGLLIFRYYVISLPETGFFLYILQITSNGGIIVVLLHGAVNQLPIAKYVMCPLKILAHIEDVIDTEIFRKVGHEVSAEKLQNRQGTVVELATA